MNSKPLRQLSISAIVVGAFALAGAATGASAATVADVTATAQGDVLQAASGMVEVRRRGHGSHWYRHGGHRGHWGYSRYHRWRPRYGGWGYVTPYWGYNPGYYGPSYYYDYYDETPYIDVTPPRGDRCGYWHRQCVKNWGARNPDYYGCMRYEKCLP